MSRTRTKHLARANAFTLIEVLLVMVILAILATIVVPRFAGRTEDTKVKAAIATISHLKMSLTTFEVDCGRYPTTSEGLKALRESPGNVQNWKGPYVEEEIPADPWGNPYIYQSPGQHNPNGFDLSSSGPDGNSGTSDDITNWTQN